MNNNENLIEIVNLKKHFDIKAGLMNKATVKAVDGVSLSIKKGETLGIVGESGNGSLKDFGIDYMQVDLKEDSSIFTP